MRRVRALVVLLGLVLLGVACGEGTVEVTETGAPVTSRPSTSVTTSSTPSTTMPVSPSTLPADATWRVYTTADGLGRDDIRFVDVAPDGTTWVLPGLPFGSDRVPHRFEDGRFTPHPAGCRIDPSVYQPLLAAPDGTAYAVCQEIAGGVTLRRFDGQRWEPFDLPPGQPVAADIGISPDGRLWMQTGDAVWAHDGAWQQVAPSPRPGPIGVGPRGELWTQLDDAVARLDGDEWTTFGHERIEVPFWDEVLVVGLDGTVWFLATGASGIAWLRLSEGTWSVLPVDLDPVAQRVDPACIEAMGGQPELYDEPAELLRVASGATIGAAVAPDGALWTAVTCVGVGRFDPATGESRRYATAEGLPSPDVEDLAVSPDGTVWVSGPWGVAHLG